VVSESPRRGFSEKWHFWRNYYMHTWERSQGNKVILSNADKATDAGTDTHKCMCIN